jgi:CBS domain-containing protein
MHARDVMTERVICINAEESVFDAAELLLGSGVSALPVVNDKGAIAPDCGYRLRRDGSARTHSSPTSSRTSSSRRALNSLAYPEQPPGVDARFERHSSGA